MRILVAEDNTIWQRLLEKTLRGWGYDLVIVGSGLEAWAVLSGPTAPRLAILDWEMPGLDGVDVCRKVREANFPSPPYLLLLTARSEKADAVVGLSVADDYLCKPFDHAELHARIKVGERILTMQNRMGAQVRELKEALAQVKQLQGMLPFCSWCKNIRDDQNYWQKVEDYICRNTSARVTHGICPACLDIAIKAEGGTTNKA